MSNRLTGKKVIILGASSGIGLATAKAAAAEGAQVTIVSSNQTRIDKALKELPAESKGVAVDLSKEEKIKAFFDHNGSFDHLIYCAGENLTLNPIADTNIDQARQFWIVRFWGSYTSVKYAAKHINSGGSINLMGGNAGQRPAKGWTIASSICSAMEGLTRALAVELAPIRVNLVAPGVVRTDLWNGIPEDDRERLFENLGNSLLTGRVGMPTDIAQSYVYLMKQEYGSGQILTVDGGGVLI